MVILLTIPFLRNLLAGTATFIVVAVIFMLVAQSCIKFTIGKEEITTKHEVIIFVVGVAVATILMPFYYLPY